MVPSLYIFIFLYVMSFFMVMSGDDWFMIWMGLEINMLSFIMVVYKRYSQSSIESCLKYFFVQSLGSAMLLGVFYMNSEMLGELMLVVLSYSVGSAPMYFWFPVVCGGLEWMACFLLLSFQKILPLMLVVMLSSWIVWVVVMLSLMLGVMGSFGQTNIKYLIAYSSIHHLGWIFLCNVFSDEVWMVYLMLYCMIVMSIVMVLLNNEIIYFFMIDKWKNKMWFAFSMLSMAGMPPMLGFFLKWIAFFFILKMNIFIIMFMIFMSVIMFYVYFRMVYDVFMYYNNSVCSLKYLNSINYFDMLDVISLIGLVSGLGLILIFIFW